MRNIDKTLMLALDNGGHVVAPGTPENPSLIAHGQRVINIEDPSGHIWSVTEAKI
ncbi:hypothetical protein [Lactococcus garvieae]|uniref:hypothetical protein n=1 Tax=Lactococcus garvieae TaxID=1363 RepID=UPI00037EA9E0|nr:hypothetical protein [Lactococcus garvieae]MBS4463661.1 hypothetical protein [Lactococcus garvieae]